MKTQIFEANSIIFREGENSTEVYRLLTGTVELTVGVEEKRVGLAVLVPGDVFGEMAMIDEHPRSISANALTEVQIEMVTPEEFNRAILENPTYLVPYLAAFFERLRSSNDRLRLELSQKAFLQVAEISLERRINSGSVSAKSGLLGSGLSLTLKVTDLEMVKYCSMGEVQVVKFPFRLGRWEASPEPSIFSLNDFLLVDEKPYHVSRNHCAIEREGDHFFVSDRGSLTGTLVNGKKIGRKAGALLADLHLGPNTLVLGSSLSPFHFTLEVG